jgi:diguanylate cyclase
MTHLSKPWLWVSVAISVFVAGFLAARAYISGGPALSLFANVSECVQESLVAAGYEKTAGVAAALLHGPFVIAFALLAVVGLVLAMRDRSGGERSAKETSQSASEAEKVMQTGVHLDNELGLILDIVATHLEKNRNYSGNLALANKRLSDSLRPEEIRKIVEFLIRENESLLVSSRRLEEELDNSQIRIRELSTSLTQERELGLRDALTQVYGRRHFDAELSRQIEIATRSGKPLALALLDIDHFKRINDTYGHQVGDEVLKSFAKLAQKLARDSDVVARFGGEEFAVIQPNTSAQQARMLAEQIQTQLRAKKWMLKDGRSIDRVTASIGITQCESGDGAADIIYRADAQLYEAKRSGRDRICIDDSTKV